MKRLKSTKGKAIKKVANPLLSLSFETQRFASMCDTRSLDKEILTIIGF